MPSFDSFNESNAQPVIDEMVRNSNPDQTVNGLSPDELDVAMRYVYKGLESGDNSNALLKWHESVFAKGGLGTIVRALTARNKTKETKTTQQEEDDD